jgi:hypothetical protein
MPPVRLLIAILASRGANDVALFEKCIELGLPEPNAPTHPVRLDATPTY